MNKLLSRLEKITRYPGHLVNLVLLSRSPLFDADWYLAKNLDVGRGKYRALLHYYRLGGFEGRDPGPAFSSSWYLNTYEDVKKAGMNPLIHYLQYGQKEGRLASSPPPTAASLEMGAPKSFLSGYVSEIAANLFNDYQDNHDSYRFGPPPKEVRNPEQSMAMRLENPGVISTLMIKGFEKAIAFIEPFLPRFDMVFPRLADDQSRRLYIKLLAYRALGNRKVKLPLNTPEYWNGIHQIEGLADYSEVISYPFLSFDWKLPKIDVKTIGFPIRLHATPKSVYTQFVLQQYKCVSEQMTIQVQPGDTVIDAGACWGDTALVFAYQCGSEGRVFSYEFVPRNLEIIAQNLEANPSIGERIHVVEHAVWDHSHEIVHFGDNGPGSSVGAASETKSSEVETLSIDDLVESRKIPRVDFIKMDIEGAELKALQGAVKTLKRDRPRLAISLYHRLEDFVELPQFLLSLDLGYQLYIRHFTIHAEETVLFAGIPSPDS